MKASDTKTEEKKSSDTKTGKKILAFMKKKVSCPAKTIMEGVGISRSCCHDHLHRLVKEKKLFFELDDWGRRIFSTIKDGEKFDDEEIKQLLKYLKGKNKFQREQAATEIRKMCGQKIIPLNYVEEIVNMAQKEKDNILCELLESLDRILSEAKIKNNYQIVNEIEGIAKRLVKIIKNDEYECTIKRVALSLITNLQYEEALPILLWVVKSVPDDIYKQIGCGVEGAIGKLALIDMPNIRRKLYNLMSIVKENIRQRIKQILVRTELQPKI